MKKIMTTNKNLVLIDDSDFEKIPQNKKIQVTQGGYAHYFVYDSKNKRQIRVWLHDLVANPSKGKLVDHINHNTLDNRRKNLRVCTHAENMRNRKMGKNNTTGFKGVHLNRGKYWYARISFNSKVITIGFYKTALDAAKAYNDKAVELFGEFALINDLKS